METNFPEPEIEVDSQLSTGSDDESAYESGLESDTTSLCSSALACVYENGRRYSGFRENKYLIPNDEGEQDRMDLHHHCLTWTLGGELFTAPLENPQRILDVGTGTGVWAMDAADFFPEAEVIGVDLSPIQPTWVPPNLRFEVDDLEEIWQYQPETFDYVHIRIMGCCLRKWEHIIQEAYNSLKPGGYIEIQDNSGHFLCDDDSVPSDCAARKWFELWVKGSALAGIKFLNLIPETPALLADAGFEDIHEVPFKIPNGIWPKDRKQKELGLYYRQHMYDGIEGLSVAMFTRVLGWQVDDVHALNAQVKKDYMNPRFHSYDRFVCIYARKPERKFKEKEV